MKLLLFVLMVLAMPVHAEVFKCTISEFNIVYQAQPCAGAVSEQKIEIKQRSAEEEAAAASNLKAWEAKYAIEQAAKKEALKADQKEMLRREKVEVRQSRTMTGYNMFKQPRKIGRSVHFRQGSFQNSSLETIVNDPDIANEQHKQRFQLKQK